MCQCPLWYNCSIWWYVVGVRRSFPYHITWPVFLGQVSRSRNPPGPNHSDCHNIFVLCVASPVHLHPPWGCWDRPLHHAWSFQVGCSNSGNHFPAPPGPGRPPILRNHCMCLSLALHKAFTWAVAVIITLIGFLQLPLLPALSYWTWGHIETCANIGLWSDMMTKRPVGGIQSTQIVCWMTSCWKTFWRWDSKDCQ